ncbi:MAG TPA: DUF393 domain-containing protein [Patescibacteria group bacterium]|nr:DUF393 domain-containing protein [Patescibacteria group bacterium]
MKYPLTVLSDGKCAICVLQINYYLKKDKHRRLRVADVSKPDFDVQTFGITQQEAQQYMHVMDASGAVYKGVDALLAIWRAVGYTAVARVFSFSILKQLLVFGYHIFAKIRYKIPFFKTAGAIHCDSETCQWKGMR